MKTFNYCTKCNSAHNWREVDYNNVLYISRENAICITLCTSCMDEFANIPPKIESILGYKQRIDDVLLSNLITPDEQEQTEGQQKASRESLLWSLCF